MISRIVVKAIEAWDPSLRMFVVMNSGAVLRVNQIVFDKHLDSGLPPIGCGVEFESNGALYYAAFDRFQEATVPEDSSDGTGKDAQ